MKSTPKDDGIRTVMGRVNNDGTAGFGSFGFTVRRTTSGQYRVMVQPKPKAYVGGVGSTQAVGVAIYQGELTPGDGASFITASAYGQSSADMTFDFVLQVIP